MCVFPGVVYLSAVDALPLRKRLLFRFQFFQFFQLPFGLFFASDLSNVPPPLLEKRDGFEPVGWELGKQFIIDEMILLLRMVVRCTAHFFLVGWLVVVQVITNGFAKESSRGGIARKEREIDEEREAHIWKSLAVNWRAVFCPLYHRLLRGSVVIFLVSCSLQVK